MKTFKLYQGYRGQRVIHTCQAKDSAEAFMIFRRFVTQELGKDSMYGYVIREGER